VNIFWVGWEEKLIDVMLCKYVFKFFFYLMPCLHLQSLSLRNLVSLYPTTLPHKYKFFKYWLRFTIGNEQKFEVSHVQFGFGIFLHLFMPAMYLRT
jgi:hypothetical protein